MIKKEVVTMQSESWFNESQTHRYVLRKQWYSNGLKEDKEGPLAVVITIRPTNTSAFVEDQTGMFIETNIRRLRFTGFIAVNLFSSIKAKNKASFLAGSDENTFEVISTVLKEKRITQIIFACGSILGSNPIALGQMKKIYDQLSSKQKKISKTLIDPNTGSPAHPLNTSCRKEWILNDFDPSVFDSNEQISDKTK